MTSLIDVIFLLLLFFMLSSTFSNFAEIEIPSGGSGPVAAQDRRILFLTSGNDRLLLNGRPIAVEDMAEVLRGHASERPSALLLSLSENTTAQRLVDLIGELRRIPDLPYSVLENS